VLLDAPLAFGTALLIIGGIVWCFMDWRYGGTIANRDGIIANRDAELLLARAQRDDYQNKLGGASPDQAAREIEQLKLALLSLQQSSPRHLSPQQQEKIIASIVLSNNVTYRIRVSAPDKCSDCLAFATEITAVLSKSRGWRIDGPMSGGQILSDESSVVLLVRDKDKRPRAAEIIARALNAANILFSWHSYEQLGRPSPVLGPKGAILEQQPPYDMGIHVAPMI
jgi:hypothetical protein